MHTSAAMVRVRGPDPKLVKAAGTAFHKAENGVTIISGSATIYICRIDVSWQGDWYEAQLVSSFAVPQISSILAPWLSAQGGRWSVAWGLGSTAHSYSPEVLSHMVCLSCQPARNSDQHSSSVKVPAQHSVQWAMHAELAPGTPIYAVGSPFGVLSPGHFANSVIHGVVSNRWPGCASGQHSGCLLTADIRSMPGMEGSPVLNSQEQVVAVLLPPLLSREFSAEVPLLVPINYVAAALPEAQQKLCAKHRFDARPPSHLQSYTEQKCPHVSKEFTPEIRSILRPSAARENSLDGHLHQHSSACTVSDTDALTVGTLQPRQVLSSHVTHHQQQQQQHLVPVRTEANILPVASTSHFHLHTDTEQQGYQPTWSSTLPSIVLISMPGSGWASGIILNKQGFILTNAHVIQPRHSGSTASEMSQSPCPDPPFNVRVGSPQSGGFRWHNASVVYVFQQVLDIAVICLSSCQPDELHPAQLMTKPASAGQAIAVMGHALFSPDCQMAPSVTAGNVTQVVYSDALNTDKPKAAAMLMTSATVHAGTSGGAVVADDGSIAGLVTSNARFAASGAIIPNLNFVIAAETLKPIWALAQHPDGLTHDALQALDVQDAALASLWKLTAPPKKEGPGSMGGTRGKAIASDRLADLLSKAGLSKALMQPDELKLPGKVESKL